MKNTNNEAVKILKINLLRGAKQSKARQGNFFFYKIQCESLILFLSSVTVSNFELW